MKFLELLMERILERRTRKYGRWCAKTMMISALASYYHYKDEAPNYAWLARKALETRNHWRQIDKTTFIYDLGPNNNQSRDLSEYPDKPWLIGTLDINDEMSLWDVIQQVIRTELYWHYLKGVPIWKIFELTEFALSEAEKCVCGKEETLGKIMNSTGEGKINCPTCHKPTNEDFGVKS